MKLERIFSKPVDRPIEGVIKADDVENLKLEVDEYVITNEVAEKLERFLDAYNKYQGANGVWISGFFGSGKSHLLKMLSFLLENENIDGVSVLDAFRPKFTDAMLKEDLSRAVSVPSKSILFNIDQKADIINHNQTDALIAVFKKVFDEFCGYFGKVPHIAQFERDLDRQGFYESFKEYFKDIAGKSWEEGREIALLESQKISEAYIKTTGSDEIHAHDILNNYRKDYTLSIEDFAAQVKDYIDTQEKGFRLNFFVDEVGQYIADNTKLMTNLQTVAESLATKCRGQSWIIVTSQNDMSTVLGDMNKLQSNDFSKIQARFATKMDLTSKNVAEVIQKRLLEKTQTGTECLTELYSMQKNNFGTLFSFKDDCRTYPTYRNRDDFTRSYPFVPYQFDLFQASIESLSRQNAFQGKHSSVGERSMLGVFQQVAKGIKDYEVGQLATFDMMYEGIRGILKSQTQTAIIAAERQLENEYANRLLKALLLVKYVKEFKPTITNLCILMTSSFDQDISELKKNLQEALSILERNTFIERNGELFEYLTDEEKDVEEEIKSTPLDLTEVTSAMKDIIFDDIIDSNKIRYSKTKQDYPFTSKLDDRIYGREYDIAVNFISPLHEHSQNRENLKMLNMRHDELMVVLPMDDWLVRELQMLKKTEKHIQQTYSATQRETVRSILQRKREQNDKRRADIKQKLRQAITDSAILIQGDELSIREREPEARLKQAFDALIEKAYPNLRMLRGVTFEEKQIIELANTSQAQLGNETNELAEAEQEVLGFIHRNDQAGLRTSVKNIDEKFSGKPYGWYYAATLCMLAKLYARSKVELRKDSEILEDKELIAALRNSREHSNVLVFPQIDFTASQIRALADFYRNFFDKPPRSKEAKVLGKDTGTNFKELLHELEVMQGKAQNYPFLGDIEKTIETLKPFSDKEYSWYLLELPKNEDDLLELSESVIKPIRSFMDSSQKEIYDNALRFIERNEPNFSYMKSDKPEELKKLLADPCCYKGSIMKDVKDLLDELRGSIEDLVNEHKERAEVDTDNLKEQLRNTEDYGKLSQKQQTDLELPFNNYLSRMKGQSLVPEILSGYARFKDEEFNMILEKMTRLSEPPSQPVPTTETDKQTQITQTKEPERVYVNQKSIKIDYKKPWIDSEEDLEEYLQKTREALLKQIRKGKRVRV